ncbi:Metallo-dependent phosphatase-like protein [Mariannaea sp. PMI_226]|nr:Metallo-dependent phosphatase-like protein [Mariannaea sp. PMI_226]
MRTVSASVLLGTLLATQAHAAPTVDELYPYTGPKVPVGDWVDNTINGNGKGFSRLVEPPAVKPASRAPSNNVNVISLAYTANGINIHYQTPFGLGRAPSVYWGTNPHRLNQKATGKTTSYDRTPPCSSFKEITQCSQFFHDVHINDLKPGKTYYYRIPAANGTTESEVLSFKTARAAGDKTEFSVAVLNDMGYTNAAGTYKQLNKVVSEGAAFAWHGGDISYADDWYSGILPCEDSWPVCYNGTSTKLPGGGPIPDEYKKPLPKGEIANQGSPQGGDMSVLYESNWDLWQQWTNTITKKVPYMVLPGNHEASCAEFDGPKNILTAYLNDDIPNGSSDKSQLTYYSCPPSQRNFTAYQNRFHMAGEESGGVGNFWYSFDYGLAHFVSINTETDYAQSPEWPFARDLKGDEKHPKENETYVTDSGPFGKVGNYSDTKSYEQYQWLVKDLAKVDRRKTPWIIVMGHRPMYSSQVSSYQKSLRDAFESVLLKYGVDLYVSGHIHWYERLMPLGTNGTIDDASLVNKRTYKTNPGVSMTHIINGAAGNLESHSTLGNSPVLKLTALLDQVNFGFGKLTINSDKKLTWKYIHGDGGVVGDELTLLKGHSSHSHYGDS